MSFDLDIGFVSLAGRKESNEDFAAAMLAAPGEHDMGAIAAIADGVSTGGMGREAAQTTVTSLVRDYFGTPATWDTTVALDRIIAAQNAWLCGINRRRAPALGLTTLTALVLRGQSYALAHVGDTRAYLLRGGRLELLTSDHVVAQADFKHQLTRSVGADERLVVDYRQGELQAGDLFVLLSDGVHGVLRAAELSAALADGAGAQVAAQALVDAALRRGGADNTTALVVQVRGAAEGTLQDENRRAREVPVPSRLLRPGDQLDGLAVTALVAQGGANLLYQVRDPLTQRLYALKTLHPRRAHDPEERAMLAHEAWLARHMQVGAAAPYLVHLHAGPPTGDATAFYLLYDWQAGETLQQMLGRGHRFGVAPAVEMALRTAQALGQLHRQGVVHRDIKPANLHRGDDGALRLLDLGVALSGREPAALRLLHAGTPSYMNPEQWGFSPLRSGVAPAEPADPQGDLFALGVTLYQLLAQGRLPYGEVLPYQAGRYWRDPVAPSRHNPQVPIWLDHVVLKAVARDQRQRFETAEELQLALERGAVRPLTAPPPAALLERDATALWKIALGISVIFNLLLAAALVIVPR
ncbi:MAG: bifunctional protein-serine/threonine kinase/phosphatase [Pseudomonadota bacterium]